MPQPVLRTALIVMAFSLAIFTTTATLAEASKTINGNLIWTESTGNDGLSTQVPALDTQLFMQHILELQASLIRHADYLEHAVDKKELGVGNAIIAAIIPGGLIYAGIRQSDCDHTRAALTEVRTLIKTLSRDILAYQYATGSVVFAQLNQKYK